MRSEGGAVFLISVSEEWSGSGKWWTWSAVIVKCQSRAQSANERRGEIVAAPLRSHTLLTTQPFCICSAFLYLVVFYLQCVSSVLQCVSVFGCVVSICSAFLFAVRFCFGLVGVSFCSVFMYLVVLWVFAARFCFAACLCIWLCLSICLWVFAVRFCFAACLCIWLCCEYLQCVSVLQRVYVFGCGCKYLQCVLCLFVL